MICKQDIQDNVFRHIAQQMKSQAVAIRSGYMPLWTDTYGTRDIC